MSNYDRYPHTVVEGFEQQIIIGWDAIMNQLKNKINHESFVLTVDTYPGVNDEEVVAQLKQLEPDCFISMQDIFLDENAMTEKMMPFLTDDRVFGKMYYGTLDYFLDEEKVEAAKAEAADAKGLTIVYGFGASCIAKSSLLVYLDMARWEIQLRYRKGMGNYNASNYDEDILRKYKRGYFVEWRMADRHKRSIMNEIDYFIDTNSETPKMITSDMLMAGLEKTAHNPFRLVPYFDPGVWGGQWMKSHCNLDMNQSNYAWSFDGVPEENSILLCFDGTDFEIPAMDLVLMKPKELLGEKNYARFGAEFPIRFDFLDTMGGQNLSLQVHPTTDYIHDKFGMAYTQDESYYILDAEEDACVYLGVKDTTNETNLIKALQEAQETGNFEAEKYINKIPAKKHDHFLIPSGTIHCSGANAMVLEISATPYIFTFKLWDWGRLGLDGKPRPINIEHGSHVIDYRRKTDWVHTNLVNHIEVEENSEAFIEHTGLHELEFIETTRYTFDHAINFNPKGTVVMANLVDGEAMTISGEGFEPFTVHYAETFILPSTLGNVTFTPINGEIKVLAAYVRGSQK